MENSIQEVFNESFGKVRVVVLNGTVYFVGKDVARALGYKDTDKTIRQHVQKQDKKFVRPSEIKNSGKLPKLGCVVINESGLCALSLKSRLPSAQSFRSWLISAAIGTPFYDGDIFYQIHARLISKHVYIMELDNGTVKIGISGDVEQRAKHIQFETGAKILRLHFSKAMGAQLAAKIESQCHETFKEKRVHGEYFNISFDEACRELDKYSAEIDADNVELETQAAKIAPLDFSRREKIELLTKLLNYPNLPLNLRNRIINNIVFLLSADFEHILQNYLNQIDE